MTYTKAPWHICQTTGRGLKLIRDENGYCVAEAVKPANSGAAYIDHVANAALIAAAPDMFIALESMVLNYAQTGRVTDKFVKEVAQILEGIVACQTK
jgi:hypothetical protein